MCRKEKKNWFSQIRNPLHVVQPPFYPPIYPDNPHPFGTCCPPNHPLVVHTKEAEEEEEETVGPHHHQ